MERRRLVVGETFAGKAIPNQYDDAINLMRQRGQLRIQGPSRRALALMGGKVMRNAKTSQFGTRNEKRELRESTQQPRKSLIGQTMGVGVGSGGRLSGSLMTEKETRLNSSQGGVGNVEEMDFQGTLPKDSISINRDHRLGQTSLHSKRKKIGVSSMVLSQNSQIMATMLSVQGSLAKKQLERTAKQGKDMKNMLSATSKECKILTAKLNRIVTSGESMHQQIEERTQENFEIMENIGLLLKIRLKDRTPPLFIKF